MNDQKTRKQAFGAALIAGGRGLLVQAKVSAIRLLEPGLFPLGRDLIQDR